MPKLIEDIYSGSAAIGNIRATLTLIVGVIIAICFSSVGVWSISYPSSRTEKVTASVENSTCTQVTDGKKQALSQCVTDIKYNVNNKEYKSTLTTGTQFQKNQNIDIQYNPNEPNDISYNETSNKYIGFILSCIGFIILCVVVLYYYLIQTYKPLAAIEGARTTVDFAKNIFD